MSLMIKKLNQTLAEKSFQDRIWKWVYVPKSKKFWFWISIALIAFCLNFFPNNLIDPFSYKSSNEKNIVVINPNYYKDIEFDHKLTPRFQSVESIVYYVNRHAGDQNDQKAKLEILVKLVRQRFHHAYAVYGMQDNWMAVFAGRYIWNDLAAIVIPDDILNHEVAACSQAAIVVMECCKQLGIDTRKVGLQGHYALEAKANGKWYYVDANLKPDFEAINGRKSLAEILENGEQYKLYAKTILDSNNIAHKFSKITYSKTNINPAPRAYIFHVVTKVLSKWGWIIPLFLAIVYYRKQRIQQL